MPEPSQFQRDIYAFDSAANGPPGAVNAVAGSGKSHTIVECARARRDPALLVAFNKHIAVELQRRLAGCDNLTISTLHALGLRAVSPVCNTRPRVEGRKYDDIVRWALDEWPTAWRAAGFESAFDAHQTVRKLIEFARLSLRDPMGFESEFAAAAACYGLEAPDALLPLVKECLAEGAAEAKHDGIIDFTDMVFLVHRWDLEVERFPVVYVDECQDLNGAQLDLVLRSRVPNARGLVVGDPAQSIFGFAFAGLDAFNTVATAISARELPLSICYRCPTSHLDLARELVPHIVPRDGAPAGEIVHCFDDELPARARAGDMVLCRYTAPLVRQCLRFIRARVPAYVKGRDIGGAILNLVDKVRKRNEDFDSFPVMLDVIAFDQHDKLKRRHAPQSVHSALDDRVECTRAVYEVGNPASWDDMQRIVHTLCADTGTGVCLSSVHRAKGLEADRVWILHPEALEKFSDQGERNVRYVALTRSRQLLGFVHPTEHNPL